MNKSEYFPLKKTELQSLPAVLTLVRRSGAGREAQLLVNWPQNDDMELNNKGHPARRCGMQNNSPKCSC